MELPRSNALIVVETKWLRLPAVREILSIGGVELTEPIVRLLATTAEAKNDHGLVIEVRDVETQGICKRRVLLIPWNFILAVCWSLDGVDQSGGRVIGPVAGVVDITVPGPADPPLP